MSLRDFRSKYAGSLLGVFWTVINPLLLLLIFTFLFGVVFKARFAGRPELSVSALYIMCGILPWLGFQEGLSRAGTVVVENQNLVTRTRFPLAVLPAYPAISALLSQLIGFFLLGLISAVLWRPIGLSVLLLPALVLLQLAFTVGLALMISGISVYLRDVIQITPVLFLVWMYATPIFYPAELVPPKFRMVIQVNPAAHLVMAYRRVLLEGGWPAPGSLLILGASALIALVLGSLIFRRLSRGFADHL